MVKYSARLTFLFSIAFCIFANLVQHGLFFFFYWLLFFTLFKLWWYFFWWCKWIFTPFMLYRLSFLPYRLLRSPLHYFVLNPYAAAYHTLLMCCRVPRYYNAAYHIFMYLYVCATVVFSPTKIACTVILIEWLLCLFSHFSSLADCCNLALQSQRKKK